MTTNLIDHLNTLEYIPYIMVYDSVDIRVFCREPGEVDPFYCYLYLIRDNGNSPLVIEKYGKHSKRWEEIAEEVEELLSK